MTDRQKRSIDTVLDELLIAYATEPISHQQTVAAAAERDRLRKEFLSRLLRSAGVVVKESK